MNVQHEVLVVTETGRNDVRRPTRWLTMTVVCFLLTGLGLPTSAQDTPTDPALGVDRPFDTLLADRLLQLAVRSLDGESAPRPEQIEIASLLMGLSLDIDDSDPEAWRTRAELAALAGQDTSYQEALKQYIRRIPEDDAAQLELITHRVSKLDTLDERIEMLERVLGSSSASRLSKPMRSRLAVAASACRAWMLNMSPAHAPASRSAHRACRACSRDA